MSSAADLTPSIPPRGAPSATWVRRYLIVLTALALVVLGGVLLWVLGLIAGPIGLLILSALLAYIAYPGVVTLQRHMSRFLAILLVFVGALVGVLVLAFSMVSTIANQLAELIDALNRSHLPPVPAWLQGVGVTPARVRESERQVAALLQAFEGKILPLISNVFLLALQSIVIAALFVYLIIYGPRVLAWVRGDMPVRLRSRINYFLDVVDQVLGGFLRGAIFLACLMGAITGAGAFLLGIPYWGLIALIVFVCEFIPVIGAYISGFLGTLLALTQGWTTGLIYLVFATILQGFLDAQVLIPRIVGKHTGLNPIVATVALLVGADLFGVAGAILAIPVVAVVQILLSASWKTYRFAHPEDFLSHPETEVATNTKP